MIKILLGGSPCTYWSIAQKNDRETEPSGIGWELFKNYVIAKQGFEPDIFVYENVASASPLIKEAISEALGVNLIRINSALVSAQNRDRIYGTNFKAEQPADRGILLRDILESGVVDREKSYSLKKHQGNARDYIIKSCNQCAFEPVRVGTIESDAKTPEHDSKQYRVYSPDGKSVCLNSGGGGAGAGAKTGLYAVPFNPRKDDKARTLDAHYSKLELKNFENFENRVYSNNSNKQQADYVAEPIPVNDVSTLSEREVDYIFRTQMNQRFINNSEDSKAHCITANISKGVPYNCLFEKRSDDKNIPIYEVKDGLITIKDKQYPIKLADGYYIIRKLTVTECCRLQTLPDDYCRAVSPSQGYKGLGNGWTAEVIIHILRGQLANVSRDEKLQVLSLYDGIGTGMYCLRALGFTNIEYNAYEIDKYAMQVATSNHPDIIQRGDAFKIRDMYGDTVKSIKRYPRFEQVNMFASGAGT